MSGSNRRYTLTHGRRGSVRLLALLAALTVLHAFDLAFTLSQLQTGSFIEGNRLAARFIRTSDTEVRRYINTPLTLAGYKLALFGLGALILYAMRRHWQAEFGAWFLLVASVGLMIWWVVYLGHVDVCLTDPAVIM